MSNVRANISMIAIGILLLVFALLMSGPTIPDIIGYLINGIPLMLAATGTFIGMYGLWGLFNDE